MNAETTPESTPLEAAARALHEARGLGETGPEEDAAQWAASLYEDDLLERVIEQHAYGCWPTYERDERGELQPGGVSCGMPWPEDCPEGASFRSAHVAAAIRTAAGRAEAREDAHHAYRDGMRFAAQIVHAEARYQYELDARGIVGAQTVAMRMTEVEKAILAVVSTFAADDQTPTTPEETRP